MAGSLLELGRRTKANYNRSLVNHFLLLLLVAALHYRHNFLESFLEVVTGVRALEFDDGLVGFPTGMEYLVY